MHRLALVATLVAAKYHEGVPVRSNELYVEEHSLVYCSGWRAFEYLIPRSLGTRSMIAGSSAQQKMSESSYGYMGSGGINTIDCLRSLD